MSHDDWNYSSPSTRGLKLAAWVSAVGCVAALGLAGFTLAKQRGLLDDERQERQAEVSRLEQKLDALHARDRALTAGLHTTQRKLDRRDAGVAPLAARVLGSVFTVHADLALGSGFAAWEEDGSMYVITAHHVVRYLIGSSVTLSRKKGRWAGEVAALDPKHDLALIRIEGHPADTKPLWQRPDQTPPQPGDQLLLVGSPFGLEGTVTTGIVSRVTKQVIQTDAAANPGNSGGPAIDRHGRAVGVLVAGGGENINFVVPIAQVCLKLRRCS